jgi:hypothetical protein
MAVPIHPPLVPVQMRRVQRSNRYRYMDCTVREILGNSTLSSSVRPLKQTPPLFDPKR